MNDKPLDPVEWELVRADIAMEKARLKANGDWAGILTMVSGAYESHCS
jgi:hypothetical protein